MRSRNWRIEGSVDRSPGSRRHRRVSPSSSIPTNCCWRCSRHVENRPPVASTFSIPCGANLAPPDCSLSRGRSWGWGLDSGLQPLSQPVRLGHRLWSVPDCCCGQVRLLAGVGAEVVQFVAAVFVVVDQFPVALADDRRRLAALVAVVRVVPEEIGRLGMLPPFSSGTRLTPSTCCLGELAGRPVPAAWGRSRCR